jgi:O-antigen/teichoic acid export membrane protein
MRRLLLRLALAVSAVALVALTCATLALAASPGASTDTPDLTDDLGSWAALVGIGLPAVVAVLQRAHWPDWANALVFGSAVVVASAVYGFVRFGHGFTWAHWQGSLLAIVVWGIGTYHLYWKRGGDNSVIAKLRAFPSGVADDPDPVPVVKRRAVPKR